MVELVPKFAHDRVARRVPGQFTVFCLHMSRPLMLAYRRWSRSCAFQAMSRMSRGTPSLRSRIAVLIEARKRYAQAASTSTRRTWLFPVRVMWPRCLLSPLECSEGKSPRYAISFGADSNRERSPSSAAMIPATSPPPFAVAERARCVTPSELVRLAQQPERFGLPTAMNLQKLLSERRGDGD